MYICTYVYMHTCIHVYMYTYIPTRIQISSQHTNCETIPKPYPLPGHSEMKLEMRYDLIDDDVDL